MDNESNNNGSAILSYEKFLELFTELPIKIRKLENMKDLDTIIKNIFSNFYIDDKKVASYELKSPFKELIKASKWWKVSNGGPLWTYTQPISQLSIYDLKEFARRLARTRGIFGTSRFKKNEEKIENKSKKVLDHSSNFCYDAC